VPLVVFCLTHISIVKSTPARSNSVLYGLKILEFDPSNASELEPYLNVVLLMEALPEVVSVFAVGLSSTGLISVWMGTPPLNNNETSE
jgi:hypothetical protein